VVKKENPDKEDAITIETAENEESLAPEQEESPLQAELIEKDRLLAEAADKYKRLLAEFDNFRKRTGKEKEDIKLVVTEQMISELLPVMDNFERAIKNAAEETASFSAGVEMIFRQFNAVFAKLGVEAIPTEGCQFDPAWHEAVMRVEDSGKAEGTILAEIQKGYKINGRIIRASMVQVAG
jgi:molecular chaperone GrpE